jgi:hypothetical protein
MENFMLVELLALDFINSCCNLSAAYANCGEFLSYEILTPWQKLLERIAAKKTIKQKTIFFIVN